MRAAAGAITGNADIESRFEDAFEFQRQIELASSSLVESGRAVALLDETVQHLFARVSILDQDEIPRLHESDGSRVMRGRQDALQRFHWNRSRLELPPYFPPRHNRLVDG